VILNVDPNRQQATVLDTERAGTVVDGSHQAKSRVDGPGYVASRLDGRRCFQSGKNATGLDQHQVRRWDSWYRYTTLVMLAHAILTVIAAHQRAHSQHTSTQLILK